MILGIATDKRQEDLPPPDLDAFLAELSNLCTRYGVTIDACDDQMCWYQYGGPIVWTSGKTEHHDNALFVDP